MFEIFFYTQKGTAPCRPEAEAESKKPSSRDEAITISRRADEIAELPEEHKSNQISRLLNALQSVF